jgi:hypothetical protein
MVVAFKKVEVKQNFARSFFKKSVVLLVRP